MAYVIALPCVDRMDQGDQMSRARPSGAADPRRHAKATRCRPSLTTRPVGVSSRARTSPTDAGLPGRARSGCAGCVRESGWIPAAVSLR